MVLMATAAVVTATHRALLMVAGSDDGAGLADTGGGTVIGLDGGTGDVGVRWSPTWTWSPN
jgi:hypothetical protein